MLNEILDRINRRLEVLGLSPATASHMAGLSKDAIRNIQRSVENGREGGVSTQTVLALAPVLKTTASWLIDEFGPEEIDEDHTDYVPPNSGLRKVVVAAHVQAGHWAETWEWSDDEHYPVYIPDIPELRGFRLHAAETRGPSMNKRYPERTVVVFTDVEETMETPIPGKRYIVERRRVSGESEHTVKLLHADANGELWLMPESDDPRFQTPISVKEGTGDGDVVAIIGRVHFSVVRE